MPNWLVGLIVRQQAATDTPLMAVCGARTDDGTPCRNPVRAYGMRCWRHGGPRAPASRGRRSAGSYSKGSARRRSSSWSNPVTSRPAWAPTVSRQPAPVPWERTRTPPAPRPPSRRNHERQRVKEAAAFCADSLTDGWQEAVADRITEYAGSAWKRLKRSHRKRNCKALARIARSILEAKAQIHGLAGHATGWVVKQFGAGDAAQAFADELASNIPLPIDAKMIAVARGVQVAGILLCVMDDRDLARCECFIDLALAETKERLQRILGAAVYDWTGLARFTS